MGNPLDETSCWTEEVAGERTGIGAIIPKSPFMATKPQEGEDYMKRLLTILMVVVMLFSVVVCASAQMEKGKKIGFVNAGPDDYYAQFGKTLVAVAKSYGMTVTEVNSDYKPEKELANVQDLIAKGVDAIAVITAGAAGSAATIKAANDAKVPIFFIAGKPDLQPGTDFTAHVTDNFVIMEIGRAHV